MEIKLKYFWSDIKYNFQCLLYKIRGTPWFKHLPKEVGEYIWIDIWGCGCCIRRLGHCIVCDEEGNSGDGWIDVEQNDRDLYQYEVNGKKFYLYVDNLTTMGYENKDSDYAPVTEKRDLFCVSAFKKTFPRQEYRFDRDFHEIIDAPVTFIPKKVKEDDIQARNETNSQT